MNFDKARHWTVNDLIKIVKNNLTEYKTLEFKSLYALALDAKNEISKDVSSFANSGGGIIIYGIRENKEDLEIYLELEKGLEPNNRFNKEWLENVIFSRVSPKIKGLYINPIKLPNNNYVYVVIIPQSTTAHMAGNNRYYKRHNFKTEPMEDYEVRDVMNRLNKPHLRPFFTAPRHINLDDYTLKTIIMNKGAAFVRHFAIRICIPEIIINENNLLKGRKLQIDNVWYREYLKQSTPNQYIFPGFRTSLNSQFLPLLKAEKSKQHGHLYIYWTIYTDKSSPQNGKTPLSFIIKNRLEENPPAK